MSYASIFNTLRPGQETIFFKYILLYFGSNFTNVCQASK